VAGWREGKLFQINFVRRPDVSLQHFVHFAQRVIAFIRAVRGHAVARDVQRIVAHVCVIRSEEDADIRCDAGQDQCVDVQVFE
jgi:hypothetical protein